MWERKKVLLKSYKLRRGFSLIEVAIALAIAGSAMVWSYSLISNGITMQKKASDFTNAVQLAKIKMAQIDSAVRLETDSSKGEIPGYRGYKFETEIKEEELDLLKLAKGEKNNKDSKGRPSDLLGSEDKMNSLMKKRGKSQGLETGGIIKVFHIKVKIIYPSGYGEESYTAETFKASKF
ncbi:MAG: type II secretion system GspH family protein [Leptospiraceae bacterium]|nr:type II secretion system protein [Leptospiraceae bacterium]MCK6379840.1 type II secretion system GspH family protein [Leptospiraceae bacterium]NUM41654.1 type II secretion system protein [Leptospiraceae bacterium]